MVSLVSNTALSMLRYMSFKSADKINRTLLVSDCRMARIDTLLADLDAERPGISHLFELRSFEEIWPTLAMVKSPTNPWTEDGQTVRDPHVHARQIYNEILPMADFAGSEGDDGEWYIHKCRFATAGAILPDRKMINQVVFGIRRILKQER